jgi:hypothetical protein
MHSVRTPALMVALLLPGAAAAWAGVPGRLVPGRLEVRAALRAAPRPVAMRSALRAAPLAAVARSGNHALRALPVPVERPGAYSVVTRWISDVATPGPDGKPKLVVMPVRGGLGLGWARCW